MLLSTDFVGVEGERGAGKINTSNLLTPDY
jgi:hypothetical protein